ncbi:MAG: hypothetical protein BAJALOKI1v1_1520007 [Promethearchaeota archaeon]|nr:MAG: hypothetical protein BAJALOKI1v1_1520007 [Candidatus Lokiarchaeota archaeon]
MLKIEYYLDVLKPHQPSSDIMARALMELKGVREVSVNVDELDQKTASLHIKVSGIDIEIEIIREKLEELNCALHSIDEVKMIRIDTPPT